jgi:hypothetical protein
VYTRCCQVASPMVPLLCHLDAFDDTAGLAYISLEG